MFLQYKFSFTVLSWAPIDSICHVPSLLHAGSRSSSSWRLRRTQTSTDSSVNWFTDISLGTNNFFSPSSCSLRHGHKFIQSCRDTPCWLWWQPRPQFPRGHVGTHSMTCDWVSSSEPSTDVTSCSTVHQHQRQTPVILLPESGPVSSQKLTSDLSELVSSSEMFTDGAMRRFQLQIQKQMRTNWAASLRTNTFSLETSSSLNLIIPRFFPAPRVAPSHPTSPQHVITRVVSAENSGEGEVHQQMAPSNPTSFICRLNKYWCPATLSSCFASLMPAFLYNSC